jgi:hypothetical protein
MMRTAFAVLLGLAAALGGCEIEAERRPVARVAIPAQPEADPAQAESRLPEPPPSAHSTFNRISSGEPKQKPARSRRASAPREMQLGSEACERARANFLRLQNHVEAIESEIDRLEDLANDIDNSDAARESWEAQVERYEEQLDRAEDDLDSWVHNERERGVPPGCLR